MLYFSTYPDCKILNNSYIDVTGYQQIFETILDKIPFTMWASLKELPNRLIPSLPGSITKLLESKQLNIQSCNNFQ